MNRRGGKSKESPRETAGSQQLSLFHRCVEIFRHQPGFYSVVAAMPYATLHPAFLWAYWFLIVRPQGPAPDLRAVFEAMSFSNLMESLALFLLWITMPFAVAERGFATNRLQRKRSQHPRNRRLAKLANSEPREKPK